MIDGFMKAICQMGIFMICAQAILHFRPNGSYEKYMKMLVSIMILVQLFLPIIKVLSFGGQGDIQTQMDQFQQQIQESMEEARKTSLISDDILSKMTLEEVKSRIDEQQINKENMETGQLAGSGTGQTGQSQGGSGTGQTGQPQGGSGTRQTGQSQGESGTGQEGQLQGENNQQINSSQAGSQEIDWDMVEESVRNSRKTSGGAAGQVDNITGDTESRPPGEAMEPVEKIEIKVGK